MKLRVCFGSALLALCVLLLSAESARAFPGVFAGKDTAPRFNQATQVVVFKKQGLNVVTILPDYQGPMQPFAWLIPVPTDVTLKDVRTLRRDVVDHIDQITAPRFAEFWEMDPCDSGPLEQEWERDLKVQGAGFLGDGTQVGDKKVPKELSIDVAPEFRDGVYTFSLIAAGADVAAALAQKGYQLPPGAAEAIHAYDKLQFLMVEVDANKIELVGADHAILSPIRYATRSEVTIASTLGLSNAKDKQELVVYVIEPSHRFEAGNYKNVFAPTNLQVDFKVKERMGEFYAGLYDAVQAKNPQSFVVEYAWSTAGCGQPCPSSPLSLSELLSLGADVYEAGVPEKERNPDPAPRTSEEQAEYQAAKDPGERKRLDEQQKELARRKALIGRNQSYVLSRLHYRYDKAGLPKDIELAAAANNVEGGVDVPQGPSGDLPLEVRSAAGESRLETRYTSLHPDVSVPQCAKPERYRWGKAPRTYRGLRKIWVAQDLATKNRSLFKLAEVVKSAVPALDLPGAPPATTEPPTHPAERPAAPPAKGKCDCQLPGIARTGDGALGFWLLGLCCAAWLRRHRPAPGPLA